MKFDCILKKILGLVIVIALLASGNCFHIFATQASAPTHSKSETSFDQSGCKDANTSCCQTHEASQEVFQAAQQVSPQQKASDVKGNTLFSLNFDRTEPWAVINVRSLLLSKTSVAYPSLSYVGTIVKKE